MKTILIKLANAGPLIIGKVVRDEPRKKVLKNPMIVYQEKNESNSGQFKIGTFLEIADTDGSFTFYDYEIKCTPSAQLAEVYQKFLDDTIQKTE